MGELMSELQPDVRETIGVLKATVKAAHERMDRLEQSNANMLNKIDKQLLELNAHMNKGKGWAAAMLLLAGSSGAAIVKLLAMLKGG
jgi:predicted  nucleic acid-binding Zn-ribbon protein